MSDKVIPINEIYTCLQGEGKLTGVPHILIRVTGCRLRCQFANSFCDTPYSSWGPEKGKFTYQDILVSIIHLFIYSFLIQEVCRFENFRFDDSIVFMSQLGLDDL